MKRLRHQNPQRPERGAAAVEYSLIAAVLVAATVAVIGVFQGAVVKDIGDRSNTKPFVHSSRPLLYHSDASDKK